MNMIVTPVPIILPTSSEPDPCENCNCPCHDEAEFPLLEIAIVLTVIAGIVTAFLQYHYTLMETVMSPFIDAIFVGFLGGAFAFFTLLIFGGFALCIGSIFDYFRN